MPDSPSPCYPPKRVPSASFDIDSYPAERTASTWLVEPLIPVGGSVLLYSGPKVGKTWLALGLSFAVARGEPWLGYATAAGPVLYLQIDMPRSLWQLNLYQRAKGHGVALPIAGTWSTGDSESLPFPFNILTLTHAETLRAEVDRLHPVLVIVDTFRKAFKGNANDDDLITAVTDTFRVACRPAAVLYIHHGKKAPSDALVEHTLMDESRGSSALTGAVDTIMRLRDKKHGKGELTIQGRAVEETTIELIRQPSLMWDTASGAFASAVAVMRRNTIYPTATAKVRALALATNRTEDTCRRALEDPDFGIT